MGFSFKNIVSQVQQLLLKPREFWESRKNNTESGSFLWLSYLLPIMAAVALAVFIGEFFRRTDFFIEYPLLKALREIALFTLTYFIGVYFTTELMRTFGAGKDKNAARKLVAYSMVPLMLVTVVTGLFPFLYVLDVVGLYSFYLFWIGARELLTFPDNKENSYILITIVVNFFIFSFLSVLLSKLLTAYY